MGDGVLRAMDGDAPGQEHPQAVTFSCATHPSLSGLKYLWFPWLGPAGNVSGSGVLSHTSARGAAVCGAVTEHPAHPGASLALPGAPLEQWDQAIFNPLQLQQALRSLNGATG